MQIIIRWYVVESFCVDRSITYMIRVEEAADTIPEAIVRENPVHVMKTVLNGYSSSESILNMFSPAVRATPPAVRATRS